MVMGLSATLTTRMVTSALVIVTADHAHSGQIIYADEKAPGLTQALMTKDGAVMTVSYGNSEDGSMGHTGTQLRCDRQPDRIIGRRLKSRSLEPTLHVIVHGLQHPARTRPTTYTHH